MGNGDKTCNICHTCVTICRQVLVHLHVKGVKSSIIFSALINSVALIRLIKQFVRDGSKPYDEVKSHANYPMNIERELQKAAMAKSSQAV